MGGDMVHIAAMFLSLAVVAGVAYQVVTNPKGANTITSASANAIATDTKALSGK